MRVDNEELIELLGVCNDENSYSSLIRCKIGGKILTLKFGIIPQDYGLVKRILEFRPFENTGVAPYQYFFTLTYKKHAEDEGFGYIQVKVEQLNRHKNFEFKVSHKYISNILWFKLLVNEDDVKNMVVDYNSPKL